MIKFSIIIPVRRINDFLKENINYIKMLNYTEYEVLIVTDEIEDFDFGSDKFKQLRSATPGPGDKRNLGAKESTGDVLAFLDDDAYPTADWLLQASKLFDNPKVYALGGPAVTPPDAPFLERMSGRVLESPLTSAGTTYRHIPRKEQDIDDYPTVNLMVKKDAFLEVGGFSTEFWPGEDTKLCLDLVKKFGHNFKYSPLPVVFHHRRNLFIPHLKQISRYGMHRGQFARIFPETSRLPSYFVPSMFIIGLIAGPLISYLIPQLWVFYNSVLSLYLTILFLESIRMGIKEKNTLAIIFVFLGIISTHLVYGTNFIVGFIKKPKLQFRSTDKKTGNYLGG
jgi:glycosyltransferase involved in cell wall biosynthesis